MIADAKSSGAIPAGTAEIAVDQESMPPGAAPVGQDSGNKKERPKTILALIEYAYGEAGRRLNLARRDLSELSVQPAAAQAEVDAVRRFAMDDRLLAVPPSLLATLAELGAEPLIRQRVLELVLVAFASHKVFESRIESLVDPQAPQILTARELNEAAKNITSRALGLPEESELSSGDRTRMRVNAVTAFGLFRVLRDRLTLSQFVEEMSEFVWDAPLESSDRKTAALLGTAKNNDALSQLSRHFEGLLGASKREVDKAQFETRQQELRAISAEARGRTLSAELEAARAGSAELLAELNTLKSRLSAEKNSRVVDQSLHVDDYEALRTQIVRRLTRQGELLRNGLHALRNGSTGVAEEFVDRAMSAIDSEVVRLKDLEGGGR